MPGISFDNQSNWFAVLHHNIHSIFYLSLTANILRDLILNLNTMNKSYILLLYWHKTLSFVWEKAILTQTNFLKCANRQKNVQVNVWNIICCQLTYIEVNQSRKKKILKFYLRQTSKLPFNLPYTTKCLKACINKTFVTSQMNHHMVSIGQQQGYYKHVSQIHK